ncbi:amidohydrolase family protein [Nguyenibacter vanlangensis]|uniref:Urease subunit alpha n=1 Tax=Nguyenibacter vanlangensis TaxID=1216886 RepID=A0ABZ3D3V6_9PROT
MTSIPARAEGRRDGTAGPIAGDTLKLADTALLVRVEHDLTHRGEKARPGHGRTGHAAIGRSQRTNAEGAVDTVITNAVIIDHWGIVKADIGIVEGRIGAIGRAGNPDQQGGVDILVGPGTEIIAAGGRIVTAGGIESPIHLVGPRQAEDALAAGVTTMIGGGTGPATGTMAAPGTPGPWHLARMIQAAEALPVNLALTGRGDALRPAALEEMVRGGAAGLMLHGEGGITAAALQTCLSVAERMDVPVLSAADMEDGGGDRDGKPVEDMIAAARGRTVLPILGARGPEMFRLAALPNMLPMNIPPSNMQHGWLGARVAAEMLHDMGALSMMASDSQGLGRVGDAVLRTWQTAHRMKILRGTLPGDRTDDNLRVRRYVAKYTINPAIAHGMADEIGSVARGKLADLVIWTPAFFGVKPDLVIKGGTIMQAMAGDAHGAIPPVQPLAARPMFGGLGSSLAAACVTFVSQAALADGIAERLELRRQMRVVSNTRGGISKKDMVLNSAMPEIEIDAETQAIRADGVLLSGEVAETLPMRQRYFLF